MAAQCLGVMGVTGAGKTELMQLLAGVTQSTSGDVFMGDLSLHKNPREFLSNIGYCPEAFGLPYYLTGREVSARGGSAMHALFHFQARQFLIQ